MVGPHAAVGLVVLEAEQPHGRQLGEELVRREGPGRLPVVDVGLDLPLEEVPERLTEELVLVALDHRKTIAPGLFPPFCERPLHCASVTDVLVGVQHHDGIRTLTLDAPATRNALSANLLDQLASALRDATGDSGVRAVVLTGAGTVFCSGADLSERGTAAPNRMPAILTSIVESAVPVIARVNGHARAGGLGLIAAADMAVAAEASTFAFTEVRVGVAPAMILVPAVARRRASVPHPRHPDRRSLQCRRGGRRRAPHGGRARRGRVGRLGCRTGRGHPSCRARCRPRHEGVAALPARAAVAGGTGLRRGEVDRTLRRRRS